MSLGQDGQAIFGIKVGMSRRSREGLRGLIRWIP